ncbi:Sporulation initiation inhibitor protein Soj [Sporomusa silvacetica DSM 10669]|uniref:Sporulation initiation inhibitor protein Soj n=1 Tax=Sporomusa silvacetica DSM 10669 TaxID=1123289 RepID=A0ABZ3IGH7_9FIRM|nr:ParA family protein [Sporomusa silvacetica]OZC13160.1 sporulation initiation inhibitor protein Soj [Sporomusa silvacetica DSM 10669]
MKTISIINLKGGVAKTITAINMAHILATVYSQRVLLIDNDKQGNTSKFFDLHSYDKPTIADLLVERDFDTHRAINPTLYSNLSVISANMNLLNANLKIILDVTRQQQTILKKALQQIESEYDYCIIDNAPDINISVINSLVAADEVIVPIKIDQFSFDGLDQLTEQFKDIREFNPSLNFKGCLITQYAKNKVNMQGSDYLNDGQKYPIFKTRINRTVKIDESTFAGEPIIKHARRCRAAKDYLDFVKEYLEK